MYNWEDIVDAFMYFLMVMKMPALIDNEEYS